MVRRDIRLCWNWQRLALGGSVFGVSLAGAATGGFAGCSAESGLFRASGFTGAGSSGFGSVFGFSLAGPE